MHLLIHLYVAFLGTKLLHGSVLLEMLENDEIVVFQGLCSCQCSAAVNGKELLGCFVPLDKAPNQTIL